jgi:hypothetical protein
MEAKGLKALVPGLLQKGHPEKIKIFGWYLHVYRNKETFNPADIKAIYEELHDNAPSSFSGYFKNLVSQKSVLKNAQGYRLTGAARDEMNVAHAPAGNKVQVSSLLENLPNLIPNLAERTYLNEALICYENGAFRAAIVMTWNLAYHHLCDHILKNRLDDFNARWVIKFAGMHKNGTKTIKVIDDFMDELKESEVVVIAKDSGIITKNVFNIMEEKLKKRNSAAHASGVVINQLQADAFIDDVVNNVVLKLV